MPATIPEALRAAAERGEGEYVFHLEDGVVRLSYGELGERAHVAARRLVALGVEPGDAVGVLGRNRGEWVVSAFATWLAGATLVPLQIPVRVRDAVAFRERLSSLVRAGGCRRVLADPDLLGLLPAEVAVDWSEEGVGEEGTEELPVVAPGDAAVLQFTSGSTSAPKGALVTHDAVMGQMEICGRCYRYRDGAPLRSMVWTPFFHDLGLFANLIHPAFSGATIHQLPTELFAKDPAAWLRLVGSTEAALTIAPSAAFGSALKALGRRGEHAELSSLEVAFFAAEAVDPEVALRMADAADALGLRPEALGSTYGLAEAVLAVACPHIGTGMILDRIALEPLVDASLAVPAERAQTSRLMVSCGPPLMDVRVVGEGGVEIANRNVGEIQIRGRSTMSCYVGVHPPDPFIDGWLRTGDLGYMADGELYVTGRAKDVMIAMGSNYYPEDFEWAAARVAGVRPGRCVAFNLPGGEDVVVLAEAANGASRLLARRITRAVGDAVGVRPSEVVVLPPGTVEKTTSGKLRRAAMRDLYASGALGADGL